MEQDENKMERLGYTQCDLCSKPIHLDTLEEWEKTPSGRECRECFEGCTHDDIDHNECMDCGKSLIDELVSAAEYACEGDR